MKELNQLKLKNKKYIIFDMDGTLIDSIGVWNITDQKLIEKYGGINKDLDEIQFERDLFLHNIQTGNTYLEYSKYLMNKYNFTIFDAEELTKIRLNLANDILAKEIDFKPNVVELILKLKSLGFILVLATMTTQVQLNVYSKINKKMLEQMNIDEVFDLIFTIDDVENKKPHPEIYNKIVQYYNASPNECLIFEDSYTGVLASHNASIEVVNVYDKYAEIDRDKINKIADYSINDYSEFIALIDTTYSIENEMIKKLTNRNTIETL